jgi:hypothetical protein
MARIRGRPRRHCEAAHIQTTRAGAESFTLAGDFASAAHLFSLVVVIQHSCYSLTFACRVLRPIFVSAWWGEAVSHCPRTQPGQRSRAGMPVAGHAERKDARALMCNGISRSAVTSGAESRGRATAVAWCSRGPGHRDPRTGSEAFSQVHESGFGHQCALSRPKRSSWFPADLTLRFRWGRRLHLRGDV